MKLSLLLSGALFALTGSASAIKIDLRYEFDDNAFFEQPGSKEAMRAVADFYESLLQDNLLRIDQADWPSGNVWGARPRHPATGNIVEIPNLIVPEDTIIVYAGGRDLGGPAGRGGPGGYSSGGSGAWFDLLDARGQDDYFQNPTADFGPWGGSIAFDTERSWNFSLTSTNEPGTPFVSIALHEMGHLLGIGTALSWNDRIVNGEFVGSHSSAVFGSAVPLTSTGGHWRDDGRCEFPDGYDPTEPNNVLSKAFGSFGAPHGFGQIVLMDPGTCIVGDFHKVMTDLDLAGLRDIGWEVQPPLEWLQADVNPSTGPFAFAWNSTSGLTYRVEKSTTLTGTWETLTTIPGDGTMKDYTAAVPADTAAFYRLSTNPLPAAPAISAIGSPNRKGHSPSSREPVSVEGCECGKAWADH